MEGKEGKVGEEKSPQFLRFLISFISNICCKYFHQFFGCAFKSFILNFLNDLLETHTEIFTDEMEYLGFASKYEAGGGW